VNKIASPHRLLSPARVRALLRAADPEYGSDFTEAEWDAITERLEALARLLWRMSYRRAEAAHSNKAISSGVEPGYERQMAGPGAPRKN
jgi:anaerobic selenocysteine-containing dehydrogenase